MSKKWTIDVSSRILRLPPYLFGELNELKYSKRQAGVDIIDLGMGNPADPTPRIIVDKLTSAAEDVRNQRYSASAGVLNLRREICKKYAELYNVRLNPKTEAIAVIGSKEGFSHLCLALMGDGDSAIVGDPYFPIHVYAVALAGGNVINVPLGCDQAFLDRITHVAEHLYPKPKLLILNYPHNPTAMTVDSVAFYDAVVDLAKHHGMMVISDLAYGRTCFDDYTAPSFMQAKGARDVGVEFTTMSKPYNMAGWRIGFCVGNSEMIRALATIKGYYDYGIFQAIQIASIIALRHCDADVAQQAKIYQQRRDVVVTGLRKLGWKVESPRASMFVWAEVPEKHLDGNGSIDFALRMMDQAEVALAPGRAFGQQGENHVRIALVENEQRLKQAIRQLARTLKENPKAPAKKKAKKRKKK